MSQTTATRSHKGAVSRAAKIVVPSPEDILALPSLTGAEVPQVFFETANSQALAYGFGMTFAEIRPDCVDTVRRHVNCTGAYSSCRPWERRSSREKLAALRYAIEVRPLRVAERRLFVARALAGCLGGPELLVEWLELSYHEALEVTRGVRHDIGNWHRHSWGEWNFEFDWNGHRFGFEEVTDSGAV